MNYLLLFPDEIDADGKVALRGIRASYVLTHHVVTIGTLAKITVVNQGLGLGKVVSCSPSEIVLEILSINPPLPPLPVELICATPRPQTVKKLLHLAGAVGVRSVTFLRSALGEKSYLSSKELQNEQIQKHLIQALEQSGGSFLPRVSCHGTVSDWIAEWTMDDGTSALLATVLPRVTGNPYFGFQPFGPAPQPPLSVPSKIILSIGGERGWNEEEQSRFLECGFTEFSLGPQMYRIEIAAAMLLGILSVQMTATSISQSASK